MKRSEMVDTIKNMLEECIQEEMIDSVLDWSEAILKEIELQGMLPPERTYTQALKDGNTKKVHHNSWEPEDD